MIYLELASAETLYVLATEIAAWFAEEGYTKLVLKSGEKLWVNNAPEAIHERILEYYRWGQEASR